MAMRLFVGVWPPDDVLDAIDALPRGGEARWTRRDQWHVTLRFYGEVAGGGVAALVDAMRAAAGACAPRTVALGPATKILGRGVLVCPVAGLDDVAAKFSDEKFRGHLTLARHASRDLAGTPFAASFEVRELALIRSHLGQGPARYETLATAPLVLGGAIAP